MFFFLLNIGNNYITLPINFKDVFVLLLQKKYVSNMPKDI
jgi:hypothetical protein